MCLPTKYYQSICDTTTKNTENDDDDEKKENKGNSIIALPTAHQRRYRHTKNRTEISAQVLYIGSASLQYHNEPYTTLGI